MTRPRPKPEHLRNMIHAWISSATPAEFEELAAALGTSKATLYQLSTNHRGASPERALQLELVSQAMHKSNKRLPVLFCGDASEVCRRCPHFEKSVGKARVLAAEFGPTGGK